MTDRNSLVLWKKYGRKHLAVFILFFTCSYLVFSWGCISEKGKNPEIPYRETKEFLISARKTALKQEEEIINSFIQRTGLKWEKKGPIYISTMSSGSHEKITKGDTLSLRYRLLLLSGKKCDTLFWEKPLMVVAGAIDKPRGLNEVVLNLHYGECALAVVPSFLAYGFFGDPPCIPQHAPLLFHVCIEKKNAN